MLTIDGSYGEGGGQILRAALSLSMITQTPFRLQNIRAKRPKPGLRPQHLTAVHAAAALCNADVEGAHEGSTQLMFVPKEPTHPGTYRFDVGTAGAVSLIFQTLLPPLAEATEPSWLILTGGTHVPWSPPYHFLEQVFIPAVTQLGWQVNLKIKRWGWYPRGGGRVHATVRPPRPAPEHIEWVERGELKHLWVLSAASNLPAHIRQRQAKRARLRLQEADLLPHRVDVIDAPSPGVGTCVIIIGTYENGWGAGYALGKRGKPAEQVAEEAVAQFLQFHRSSAAVDPHLADQLVVPLIVRGASWAFSTPEVTNHLRTVIWLSTHFIPASITITEETERIIIQCSN